MNQTVTFIRKDGFYCVDYPEGYHDWNVDAKNNPGTIRIEDMYGKVLWEHSDEN